MPGLRSPEIRSGLRLLWRTFGSYKRDAAVSIGFALLWMAMVVSVPYLIRVVIDRAISADRPDLLAPLTALVVVAGVLMAAGVSGRRYFGFRFSYRAEADLRRRMFEHIQRLQFSFHDETPTGQLMARASSDLSQVRLVFAMLPITLANIGMFLAVIVILVAIDPVLGLAASVTVPALLVTVNRFSAKVIGISFDIQQRLADLSQDVEEAIGGIQVVKSYGQEEQENAKLGRVAERIYDRSVLLARLRSTFAPLFELIPSAATVMVLWLGGIRVIDGAISLGEFVAFTQYLAVLIFPLRITGWFFANLPRAAAAATRVQALLRTAPQVVDPAKPRRLAPGPGEVVFHDVDFSYPEGPPVLQGVDLTIRGGTSVALVGATGSGKTTLAHLIPRYYDVTAGRVTLDGIAIDSVRLDELRREVAVVFQETFLFSASIRDNIAFGAEEASDEQIRLAARLAQAHRFIIDLPDGYDTVVGERGYSLSGGQRQRVALARAVVRDPRVLILDDATSSVDAIVEAEIQAALEQVMQGRTTVIIAHRTSTLAIVDQVVFLESGRVVATGSHQELVHSEPRYRELLAQEEARR